jgi:hypothetical protein
VKGGEGTERRGEGRQRKKEEEMGGRKLCSN